MRFGRWLGIGVLLLSLGTVAVALIVLWRWNMPSAAARALGRVVAERPVVPDSDNGFHYVWGFIAAPDADAAHLADERVAWLRHKAEDPDDTSDDPLGNDPGYESRRSNGLRQLAKVCRSESWNECAANFDAWREEATDGPWDAAILARYHALRARSGWFESFPFSGENPLPPYGAVLDAQRLEFRRLRDLADAGQVEELRTALDADLRFWRGMLRDADILISKMMATAGIRQHFFLGNLVLRRLPAARISAAIPAGWNQPFSTQELSMLRTLAGELQFTRLEVNRQAADNRVYDEDGEPIEGPEAVLQQLIAGIGRQVRPPQRLINRFAEVYLATANGFTVPLDQYTTARTNISARFPHSPDTPDATSYAIRVGSIEGMRRAALLTAQLRGRAVGAGQVADELRRAALRNPFTKAPFEWDAVQHAVKFESLEEGRFNYLWYFY